MPVYNALPHLDAAVRSILDQSHRDFEFVIYDDASTDGSTERLRQWAAKDGRIRLFEGERNLGPVGSSTCVMEQSAAPLVARMDADDASIWNGSQRQLRLFGEKPGAGLVGTLFEVIDATGRRIRSPDFWRLARHSAFVPFAAHGSIMFRRSVFDQVGGHRLECEFWEDQDLVARMATAAEAWSSPPPCTRSANGPAKHPPPPISNGSRWPSISITVCVDRLEHNRGYDDLLRQGDPRTSHRLDPRVFIAAGSRQLWAGARPFQLRRLLTRGKLGFDLRTMSALVWTSWASISPSSLRVFLKLLLGLKNIRARDIAARAEPVRRSPVSAGIGAIPNTQPSEPATGAPSETPPRRAARRV